MGQIEQVLGQFGRVTQSKTYLYCLCRKVRIDIGFERVKTGIHVLGQFGLIRVKAGGYLWGGWADNLSPQRKLLIV